MALSTHVPRTHRLKELDPEIARLLGRERYRQATTLSLVASESLASPVARSVQGSVLSQKLGEGYPGRRYCTGCEVIDQIEALAIARACALFGAEHANVQPYSGTFANIAALMALLRAGDPILAMHPRFGGHHSHGEYPHLNARLYRVHYYGVHPQTGLLDYEEILDSARKMRPRLIIAGSSFYPRIIDFERFARIAEDVEAYLLVDMAHIAGLIATGVHPSPFPWADVVTSSTHKTLTGPRGGGLILAKQRYAEAIDAAVWPGLQGAPVMEVIAARAVVFREAATPAFHELMERVVRNARALAHGLMRRGIPVRTNGTDTHLVLADLRPLDISASEAEQRLARIGITSNEAFITDRGDTPEGLRFGSVVATQRGLAENDMDQVAELIVDTVSGRKGVRMLRQTLREIVRRAGG